LNRDETTETREVMRVTGVGLGVNLVLAAVKVAAGILGRSHAVVADGVHSLSDITTDVAVLVGARYWRRPPDAEHPHGHGRIEVVTTVFIGLFLAAVALGLIYDALLGLGRGIIRVPGWVAFVAAVVSVVTKEILYHWTVRIARSTKSGALAANAWHHRMDAFSSVPVAAAVAVAAVRPDWWFVDPVGGVVVAVLILWTAGRIIFSEVGKLIDRGAPQAAVEAIEEIAAHTEGVRGVHAVRTRYKGPYLAVDLHITVNPQWTVRRGHATSEKVKRRILESGPDVSDVMVHLEPDGTPNNAGEWKETSDDAQQPRDGPEGQ
jgi:cation diffusion facilitator family transporter